MAPETRGVFDGGVAVGGKVLDELFEGEAACLGKTVHAAADLGHDVTVVDERGYRLYSIMMASGMAQTGMRMYS